MLSIEEKQDRKSRFSRQQDEDHINFMNQYLMQASKTIWKIKQHVYSIMNLSVPTPLNKKTVSSIPMIRGACKQNLEDLRKVESVLKGYHSSVTSMKNETNERQKASEQTSTVTTINSPTEGKQFFNEENDKALLKQLLELTEQNNKYKEELKHLKIQIQRQKNQDLPSQSSPINSNSPLSINLNEKISPSNQPGKQLLNRCKSELSSTTSNIEKIRNRNKQCLMMVKDLKKVLDLSDEQGI